MKTLHQLFQEAFTEAIARAFTELPAFDLTAEITPCNQEGFGHYQCNSAMRLAKLLKKNPRVVAEQIRDALSPVVREMCETIELAGPGFINCTLSPAFLSAEVEKQFRDPHLGVAPLSHKSKIIVEFSSPNIAKELHVGHIRSTIVGDALARLFEFLGYDVLRLNHIGDWGTQFGMLISYLQENEPAVLRGEQETDLTALMAWYRASKKRFDEDEEFKKRSQLAVVQLQSGEARFLQAWKLICDLSRKGFQEIYDLLDVRITERGESFYNPLLKGTVEELEQKGLVVMSEGAKCIFLEGFVNREGQPLPMLIQKADGGYNYTTTDLAALRYRIFTDRAERIVIVTDVGQQLHFQMIFGAAKRAGWLTSSIRVDHVGLGLVLGADGKKFKTRSGQTEKLIDLLTEAVDRARAILVERLPDASSEELDRLARILGIGALKYADLSSHRTKDYTFSYDRMLRFEGNTAIFLLYAYVRIHGIQRKVGRRAASGSLQLRHPSEMALGLHLRRLGETLEAMAQELLPNRLTDYLYELAEKFNAFFRDCRVEGSPEEESRLLLCEATARILKQGLEILGLRTVDRM